MSSPLNPPRWPETRARKFRLAAFVYLHVALLYEYAAYTMWRNDLLPTRWGPGWLWMIAGAVVAAAVFVGLLRWQNEWFARVIWLIHGLRLPSLIEGAFVLSVTRPLAPSFYLTAMVVVVVNLWTLARAAWDL